MIYRRYFYGYLTSFARLLRILLILPGNAPSNDFPSSFEAPPHQTKTFQICYSIFGDCEGAFQPRFCNVKKATAISLLLKLVRQNHLFSYYHGEI